MSWRRIRRLVFILCPMTAFLEGVFLDRSAFATIPGPGPCVKGPDCTAVPHHEFYSYIFHWPYLLGVWSIGSCPDVDTCTCNGFGLGHAVKGVRMIPKGQGTSIAELYSVDVDHYWITGGNDGFCAVADMKDGGVDIYDQIPIDETVPGTTLLSGLSVAVDYTVGCGTPWHNDTCQEAEAYIHVYEITLEADESVPMTISWQITPFAGSTEVDVTPQHLMLSVEGGLGQIAQAGPYSGWSGSETWTGDYFNGTRWDGCSQVTISLGIAPNPPPVFGMTSVFVDDYDCGTYTTSSAGVGKSITVPCPGAGGEPELAICKTEPSMPYVCPGCCIALQARACPLLESVSWEVDAGAFAGYVQLNDYGSSAGLCLNPNFPPSGEVTLTVAAYLTDSPNIRDEIDITVWTPSPNWPCTGGIGNCHPDLTEWECDWLLSHPFCAPFVVDLRDDGLSLASELFPEGCRGGDDCTVGNAFLHAYVNSLLSG